MLIGDGKEKEHARHRWAHIFLSISLFFLSLPPSLSFLLSFSFSPLFLSLSLFSYFNMFSDMFSLEYVCPTI